MSGDYVRGEMDITSQKNTWEAFMKVTTWSALIIMLVLAYATFTITMGMHWVVAMGILAIVGIVGGLILNMRSAWIATVVGLCAVGVVLQLIIWFAGAVL